MGCRLLALPGFTLRRGVWLRMVRGATPHSSSTWSDAYGLDDGSALVQDRDTDGTFVWYHLDLAGVLHPLYRCKPGTTPAAGPVDLTTPQFGPGTPVPAVGGGWWVPSGTVAVEG